jgi:hypothetical protein
MSSLVRKTLAVTLAVVMFVMDGALINAAESNFWSQRHKAAKIAAQAQEDSAPLALATGTPLDNIFQGMPSLDKAPLTPSLSTAAMKSVPKGFLGQHKELLSALPFQYGDIRHIALPQGKAKGVVVNIQDIHMNLEAQRNMAGAVESLMTKGQAGLLALEGAFGDTRVELYRTFPNKEALRMAADYMLRKNGITGPVFAALTHKGNIPPIVGVDDKAHYDANVQAYVQSAPAQAKTKEHIASLQKDLSEQKTKVYNPELQKLDAVVEGYRSGTTALGDYLKALRDAAPDRTPTAGQQFLKTLDAEESLDFTQVENQRTRLITKLSKSLSDKQVQELVQYSLAYRAGQMRYADFYRNLKDLTAKAGVKLNEYPAMDAYVKYVIQADGIDAATLFKEMGKWEQTAYDRLTRTEEEKTLAQKSKSLSLSNKLADFSLTRHEWEDYAALKVNTSLALSTFEGFYTEAQSRDDAMVQNLLKAMETNKTKSAVLVTGGFHTEGIADKLKSQGWAVVTYTPKITKVDTENGSAYLSVFTREKTPLEKLFAGEKLFITDNPERTLDSGTAVAPLAAVAAPAGVLSEENEKAVEEIAEVVAGRDVGVEVVASGQGTEEVSVTVGAQTVKEGFTETPGADGTPTLQDAGSEQGDKGVGKRNKEKGIFTTATAWVLSIVSLLIVSAFQSAGAAVLNENVATQIASAAAEPSTAAWALGMVDPSGITQIVLLTVGTIAILFALSKMVSSLNATQRAAAAGNIVKGALVALLLLASPGAIAADDSIDGGVLFSVAVLALLALAVFRFAGPSGNRAPHLPPPPPLGPGEVRLDYVIVLGPAPEAADVMPTIGGLPRFNAANTTKEIADQVAQAQSAGFRPVVVVNNAEEQEKLEALIRQRGIRLSGGQILNRSDSDAAERADLILRGLDTPVLLALTGLVTISLPTALRGREEEILAALRKAAENSEAARERLKFLTATRQSILNHLSRVLFLSHRGGDRVGPEDIDAGFSLEAFFQNRGLAGYRETILESLSSLVFKEETSVPLYTAIKTLVGNEYYLLGWIRSIRENTIHPPRIISVGFTPDTFNPASTLADSNALGEFLYQIVRGIPAHLISQGERTPGHSDYNPLTLHYRFLGEIVLDTINSHGYSKDEAGLKQAILHLAASPEELALQLNETGRVHADRRIIVSKIRDSLLDITPGATKLDLNNGTFAGRVFKTVALVGEKRVINALRLILPAKDIPDASVTRNNVQAVTDARTDLFTRDSNKPAKTVLFSQDEEEVLSAIRDLIAANTANRDESKEDIEKHVRADIHTTDEIWNGEKVKALLTSYQYAGAEILQETFYAELTEETILEAVGPENLKGYNVTLAYGEGISVLDSSVFENSNVGKELAESNPAIYLALIQVLTLKKLVAQLAAEMELVRIIRTNA